MLILAIHFFSKEKKVHIYSIFPSLLTSPLINLQIKKKTEEQEKKQLLFLCSEPKFPKFCDRRNSFYLYVYSHHHHHDHIIIIVVLLFLFFFFSIPEKLLPAHTQTRTHPETCARNFGKKERKKTIFKQKHTYKCVEIYNDISFICHFIIIIIIITTIYLPLSTFLLVQTVEEKPTYRKGKERRFRAKN